MALENLAAAILVLVIAILVQNGNSAAAANLVKTKAFLSPEIVLEPGQVADKYYYGVDFPRGHIGVKSFTAELVDARGNPVSLHETYLHHWVLQRYHARRNSNGG